MINQSLSLCRFYQRGLHGRHGVLRHHQSNGRYRRTLSKSGPSVLVQEVPEALDDRRSNGVRVGRWNCVLNANGIRHDYGERWNVSGISCVRKSGGKNGSIRLGHLP